MGEFGCPSWEDGLTDRLPYDLREAVISACGKAFWLKDSFRAFFLSCGVPPELYARFAEEPKYKIARRVLSELELREEEGFLIQRRIATELAKLRRVPDENVPDMDEALSALRRLKRLAVEQRIIVKKERADTSTRIQESQRRAAASSARSAKLRELHARFCEMLGSGVDAQRRGYGLEGLLKELFEAWGIDYRPPYRTPTEQIDGHFCFQGFDYLVEARWREQQPTEGDISAFKGKVDRKIESTRGVFVSLTGFRQEVVDAVSRGGRSNLILMDGQDLALILEGQISLLEALDLKTKKAAQEGVVFFPLVKRFTR